MVLTRFGRDDSRGQVLILIAVVVGLVIISSALALNSGIQATIDTADGVSTTEPEAIDLMEDINEEIQASIVASNRDSSIDIQSGDLITQQEREFSNVTEYSRHTVDITVEESIDGERLYNDTEGELTNDTHDDWTVVDGPVELTGGIEVNADSISNADGPLHIETSTHDIYLTSGSEDTVEAEVEHGGETTTYISNRTYPYIDLGAGTFAGYRFREYDQRDMTEIKINNGNAADGTIEFVVTGSDSFDDSLTQDSDATFGVVYSVDVQTEGHTITSGNIATHGPIRGDF